MEIAIENVNLTKRQIAMYRFMLAYQRRELRPASTSEISNHLGITAPIHLMCDLTALKCVGLVQIKEGRSSRKYMALEPNERQRGTTTAARRSKVKA